MISFAAGKNQSLDCNIQDKTCKSSGRKMHSRDDKEKMTKGTWGHNRLGYKTTFQMLNRGGGKGV